MQSGAAGLIEVMELGPVSEVALREIGELNKSSKQITMGFLVGLVFPVAWLVVPPFAILKIVQARRIVKEHPRLGDPYKTLAPRSKREVRKLARQNLPLQEILRFKDARAAFWLGVVGPLLIFAFFAVVIAAVS